MERADTRDETIESLADAETAEERSGVAYNVEDEKDNFVW